MFPVLAFKKKGKSLFLAIQLLAEFDFDYATSRSGILDHQTIKTVYIWPSGGFTG